PPCNVERLEVEDGNESGICCSHFFIIVVTKKNISNKNTQSIKGDIGTSTLSSSSKFIFISILYQMVYFRHFDHSLHQRSHSVICHSLRPSTRSEERRVGKECRS